MPGSLGISSPGNSNVSLDVMKQNLSKLQHIHRRCCTVDMSVKLRPLKNKVVELTGSVLTLEDESLTTCQNSFIFINMLNFICTV